MSQQEESNEGESGGDMCCMFLTFMLFYFNTTIQNQIRDVIKTVSQLNFICKKKPPESGIVMKPVPLVIFLNVSVSCLYFYLFKCFG